MCKDAPSFILSDDVLIKSICETKSCRIKTVTVKIFTQCYAYIAVKFYWKLLFYDAYINNIS